MPYAHIKAVFLRGGDIDLVLFTNEQWISMIESNFMIIDTLNGIRLRDVRYVSAYNFQTPRKDNDYGLTLIAPIVLECSYIDS